jgi:hypothetical protein
MALRPTVFESSSSYRKPAVDDITSHRGGFDAVFTVTERIDCLGDTGAFWAASAKAEVTWCKSADAARLELISALRRALDELEDGAINPALSK